MTEVINADNFKSKVLDSEVPVLVDFFATWCGPCMRVAPVVDEINEELAGEGAVYKVDIDESSALASEYKVVSVPTFILFKGGEPVKQVTGGRPKADLMAMFE